MMCMVNVKKRGLSLCAEDVNVYGHRRVREISHRAPKTLVFNLNVIKQWFLLRPSHWCAVKVEQEIFLLVA